MENELTTQDLRTQNIALNNRVAELENTVAELSALVNHFKELFRLSQIKRFAASGEKLASEQLSLFDAANSVVPVIAETQTEGISYTRRKQKGKREADLSKLPLTVVEHEIPEGERVCPSCGEIMQPFGVDIRDEIKIIPAQVVHVEHRCHVYKCGDCAKTADKTPIVKARMPAPVIKGNAVTVLEWKDGNWSLSRAIKSSGTFLWPREDLGDFVTVTRAAFSHLISYQKSAKNSGVFSENP